MHFYYFAGINSQSFAGAGGSGHTHCGSEREWSEIQWEQAGVVRNSVGAGGNGMKKTVSRRALLCAFSLSKHLCTVYICIDICITILSDDVLNLHKYNSIKFYSSHMLRSIS